MKKKTLQVKIVDCECNGSQCCGGRGIAVFSVVRKGKTMRVCTKCDFSSDENRQILRYVKFLPVQKLIDFHALGAVCLGFYIRDKEYPFTKGLYK